MDMNEKKQEKQEAKKIKKQLAAKRRKREIRWDKLDNTAHLFPAIAGENMSNVYRISVTLKEEIQKEFLQQALDIVLPKFDGFNVRLRRGIFWYYFEENGKPAPRVQEEHNFPCRFIRQNKNRSYLFRVTYYRQRINLEVFHVLTDGMGGLNFLRELTYQYLRLVHGNLRTEAGDTLSCDTSLNREDSFLKNFKKAHASGYQKKRAFLIRGEKLPAGEFGVMHGKMPIRELKEAAHRYGASINEYLVSAFAWSVYTECMHGAPSEKPIRVAVPVNLRPYFHSVTTKNFFIMVSAEFHPKQDSYTFAEVVEIIRESLKSQITKEHMEELFSYGVIGTTNPFIRQIPLTLKNIYMSAVYSKSALANTTTVTNIGNVSVEDDYRPYIERFDAFLAMSKGQSLKGTICSFGDELVFTFSTVLEDTSVQKGFFRQIASDGVPVAVESNGVFL